MGYGVYWANGRWQGYEIPAYCDYPGCRNEIDRGMGYVHIDDKNEPPLCFCCKDHKYEEGFEIEYKEHPDWLRWILSHESWGQWRKENPKTVAKYKTMLKELE